MEGPVSKRLLIHIILAVLVVAFTGVLITGFVQENLARILLKLLKMPREITSEFATILEILFSCPWYLPFHQ
jgi:hypothetical protein